MHLTVLAVPGCPNVALLEEQLAGVYLYAAQRLGRPARQLRLVSGNAFDIVGAGAAGVRTAWVNRVGAPFDTIGKSPEIIVSDLGRLPDALAG